ncbi:MAG: glycine cleavage system protein GcvH [Proteobacteria bacterium]|nr:glycine cleavage system protein GcvH [Pseudomonadota bacterium]MCL2307285.1 glycine cleavage system protein GcvH [Pseudomonadota bacterium]
MSHIPANLKYTANHEWVRREADGALTVGITDHAQESLGDLVFVELPDVGRTLAADEACTVVESVKAASDVYAPVAGTVVAQNEAVKNSPELINQNAYDAWLFKLQPADVGAFDALLSADAYAKEIG